MGFRIRKSSSRCGERLAPLFATLSPLYVSAVSRILLSGITGDFFRRVKFGDSCFFDSHHRPAILSFNMKGKALNVGSNNGIGRTSTEWASEFIEGVHRVIESLLFRSLFHQSPTLIEGYERGRS